MSESPILEYWPEGISAARIPANNNVRLIQALLLNPAISATTAAQPGSPAEGDVYILPASPTGSMWASFFESDVVIFYNATWTAYEPAEGLRKFVDDEGQDWQFVGDSSGGWAPAGGGGGGGVSSVNGQTGSVVLVLDDLDDVDAGSPSLNDVLTWDGSDWVNQAGGGSITVDGTPGIDELVLGTNLSGSAAGSTYTINAAGGGGGGGSYVAPGVFRRTTATYFFNDYGGGFSNSAGVTPDRVYYIPFIAGNDIPAFNAGMNVTSGTTGKFHVGIFENDDSGAQDLPGTLLEESGDISTSGGVATDAFSNGLTQGVRYWVGVLCSVGIQCRAIDADQGANMLGRISGGQTITYLYEDILSGWTVLPTPGTLSEGNGNNYACPLFTL